MNAQSDSRPGEAPPSRELNVSVAIVGAGVAGLVAARELAREGVSITVLESAERVGGRTLSEMTAFGSHVDLGGQWIGHNHFRFQRLAEELGANRFRMHSPGRTEISERGRALPSSDPSKLECDRVLAVWDDAAKNEPSEGWEECSVEAWLAREVVDPEARRMLQVLVTIMTTADLDRFSMAAWIKMLGDFGGLAEMMATTGGAQDSMLVEGAGSVATRIAGELDDRILLGHRVLSVARSGGQVVLATSRGSVRADRAIVAIPPPMLDRVDFAPPLPTRQAEMAATTYMGSVYKAISVYERPFWRDAGDVEGYLVDRPGSVVFDASPPDGAGHLVFLIGGAEAREFDSVSVEERQHELLGRLVPRFGERIASPIGWHEKSWHLDEHVGGGYIALPDLGSAYTPDSRAEDDGLIFWAGAERADEHPGYIEGAIESGERAAREALAALSGQRGGGPGGRTNTEE